MKIQDREQTNIIPSLVAIETILAHESTPRPSLFKLLLDEINFINTSQGMIFITIAVIQRDRSITALIKKIPGPYIRQRKTNKTPTSENRKQQMYINPP